MLNQIVVCAALGPQTCQPVCPHMFICTEEEGIKYYASFMWTGQVTLEILNPSSKHRQYDNLKTNSTTELTCPTSILGHSHHKPSHSPGASPSGANCLHVRQKHLMRSRGESV